jgi:hypothetical protein
MNLNVTVHIEELVLHGFAPGDRHAIAEGLQSELARRFATNETPGMLTVGGVVPRIAAPPFEIDADSPPQQIGAQIAESVWNRVQS